MTESTADTHVDWQRRLAADPWLGWRSLLKGEKVPVDPNEPFQGYYRSKNKDKTFSPIAFWKEGDEWKCLKSGREYRIDWAIENWPFISRYPISHEWYVAVAERGEPWPDADARVSKAALAASRLAAVRDDEIDTSDIPETGEEFFEGARLTMGGNNPPEETPREEIANQIENAKGGIRDYVDAKGACLIKNDEQAAKARSLKNRLAELSGNADKIRTTVKAPFLAKCNEIDGEWMPLVKDAKAAAETVNKAENAYQTERLKKQRAEEARVAAEQAERDRIERENAAKLADAEEVGVPAPELAPVPEVKPAAEVRPVSQEKIRPGYGRAGRVETEWYVVEITDIDALFGLLKSHTEMKQKMMELAQRALAAGYDVPGIKKDERAKVRG